MLALAAGVGGAFLCAALFLAGLVVKERDNRFCVSCHLHDEKFQRVTSTVATDLAAFHHQKKPEIGCIACHGGADTPMLLKVWAVAAVDTVKFLAGAYTEPTHMRVAFRDAECRQCHTPILVSRVDQPAPASASGKRDSASAAPHRVIDPSDESTYAAETETEGRAGLAYHGMRGHDTVKVACMRCHPSHTTESDAASQFIGRARVQPICRDCHKEL